METVDAESANELRDWGLARLCCGPVSALYFAHSDFGRALLGDVILS